MSLSLALGQQVLATRFYQHARDVPRASNRTTLDWGEQEARCNLEKLRRLRSAATLEAKCENLSLLQTGK